MMNSNQFSIRPSLLRNKLLLAIATFSFLGFADSAYLTADHYFALPLPCSLLHGCDVVLTSAYSMVGPIPLAALGVAFYLLALFTAVHAYTSASSRRLDMVLFGITVIGFGMSIIFEGIQALLIHAFCQYCALSAVLATLMFMVSLWLVRNKTIGKDEIYRSQ